MTTFSPPIIKTFSRRAVFHSTALDFLLQAQSLQRTRQELVEIPNRNLMLLSSLKWSCTDNSKIMHLLSACLCSLTDQCVFSLRWIYNKKKNLKINRRMPFSFSSISFTTQCRFFFPLKFTYDCQASRKVRGRREKYLLMLHTYGPLSPHTLNLASVSLMFLTPLPSLRHRSTYFSPKFQSLLSKF